MKRKEDPGQITPEEKEILRKLMESPRVEKEWDFFEGMKSDTPPPEYFMRGRPEPRVPRWILPAVIGFVAGVIVGAVWL